MKLDISGVGLVLTCAVMSAVAEASTTVDSDLLQAANTTSPPTSLGVGEPWLQKAMIAFVIVGFLCVTLLVFCFCRCIRQSIKREDRRAGLLTNPDTLSESQFKKLQRQSSMVFGRKKREQARQKLEGLVQVPLVDAIEESKSFGSTSRLQSTRRLSFSLAPLVLPSPPEPSGPPPSSRRFLRRNSAAPGLSFNRSLSRQSLSPTSQQVFGSGNLPVKRRQLRRTLTQTAQTFSRMLTRPQLTIPAMDGETYNNTVTAHRSYMRRASMPASALDACTLNSRGSCEQIVARAARTIRTVQIQTGDDNPVYVIEENVINETSETDAHTVQGKTKTFTVTTPAESDIAASLLVRMRNRAAQTDSSDESRALRRQSEPSANHQLASLFDSVRSRPAARAGLAAGDALVEDPEVSTPLLAEEDTLVEHSDEGLMELQAQSAGDFIVQVEEECLPAEFTLGVEEPDVQTTGLSRCDENSDQSSDTGIGYSVDDRASPDSGETTCL